MLFLEWWTENCVLPVIITDKYSFIYVCLYYEREWEKGGELDGDSDSSCSGRGLAGSV